MVEELLFIRGGKFVVFLINREAVIHCRIAKASENVFIRLTFYSNSINYCKQSSSSQCEILRQISLLCLVQRILSNRHIDSDFSSAALSLIVVATATPHSSVLQMKKSSCVNIAEA